MEPTTALFGAVVVFAAYLVRGVAGFGSALVAVPLLALQFPVAEVVPLIVLLDYLGSASQGLKNRQSIAWSDLLPLIPFSFLGVGVGLLVMQNVEPGTLTLALGCFVVVYAVYQLLPLPELRGSRFSSLPYGMMGGIAGTLFGTGGPFYVIYLTLRGLGKQAFRATFAANFLIDGALRLGAFALLGLYGGESLPRLAVALPIAGVALFVGGHVHTNIGQKTFGRLISILLLASGAALIARG